MYISAACDIRSGAPSQRTAAMASRVAACGLLAVGLIAAVVADSPVVGGAGTEADEATLVAAVVPAVCELPLEQPADTVIAPTRTAFFQNALRVTN